MGLGLGLGLGLGCSGRFVKGTPMKQCAPIQNTHPSKPTQQVDGFRFDIMGHHMVEHM